MIKACWVVYDVIIGGNMHLIFKVLSVVGLLMGTSRSLADVLRCGGNIIKNPMTLEEVTKLCGDPIQQSAYTIAFQRTEKDVEKAFYKQHSNLVFDQGSTSVLYEVEFVDGKYLMTHEHHLSKASIHADCLADKSKLKVGDSMTVIELLCGKAKEQIHTGDEMRPTGVKDEKKQFIQEKWIYKSGEKELTLIFDDKKLKKIL
jgi:hypothetical protein